ncbi:hypothetical protein VDG41_18025 [Xanthomonas campestris pv. raphani]|nr:hypothetical protein [Xanthomonas campestris pv. raphani]
MPFVWGDFNTCGWAGDEDKSIYALDLVVLETITAKDNMLAFIWTNDEPGPIRLVRSMAGEHNLHKARSTVAQSLLIWLAALVPNN